VNMNDDLHIVATTKTNFQYILWHRSGDGVNLHCAFVGGNPCVYKVYAICDTFLIVWFVIVVKMCCVGLYNMYSNPKNKYGVEQSKTFLDLHKTWMAIVNCLVD
jgi:hypothetical protein